MDPAYRKLLQHRKKMIQEQLEWTPELSKELTKENILPRAVIKELEMESNMENRIYVLLAKLPMQTGSDLFTRFCTVLERCGQTDLATILREDQDSIDWDFTAGIQIHSVSQYAEVLESILIQRLIRDEDRIIRKKLVPIISDWVHNLSIYIRQHDVQYSQMKQAVLEAVKSARQLSPETARETIDLQNDREFDRLLHLEEEEGKLVLGEVNTQLKARDDEKDTLLKQIGDKDAAFVALQTAKTEAEKPTLAEEKVATLEKILKDQDQKIMKLESEAYETEESLKISPFEFEQTLKQLRPFVRKGSIQVPNQNGQKSASPEVNGEKAEIAPMQELKEAVEVIVDMIERMRKRTQQTGDHIASLETEKKATLSVLGVNHKDASLPTLVSSSLTEVRDTNLQLKRELDDTQQHLQDKTKANETLQDDFNEVCRQRELLIAEVEELRRALETAKQAKTSTNARRSSTRLITPVVEKPKPRERQVATTSKVSLGLGPSPSPTLTFGNSAYGRDSPRKGPTTNGYLR